MSVADLIQRVVAYADDNGASDAPFATEIPGLSLVRARRPTAMTHQLYQPVFCLVLQGTKQVTTGERSRTFGAMETLMVGVHMPAVSRIVDATPEAPYAALAVDLDAALLRETAPGDVGKSDGDALPGPGIAVDGADAAVVDVMERLFNLCGRPKAAAVLAPLAMREVHFWVQAAGHAASLAALTRVDGKAERIARAVAVIRRDYVEPLRVGDLAKTAGMSPSSFHAHFRAVTETTPLQFQKQLRLLEARRRLIAGEGSVSEAAYAVGYESPTQFAREYARAFGRSPRRDLTNPRSGAEPVSGKGTDGGAFAAV